MPRSSPESVMSNVLKDRLFFFNISIAAYLFNYWLLNWKPFAYIHLSIHPSIHPSTFRMANRISWHVVSIQGEKRKSKLKELAPGPSSRDRVWLHKWRKAYGLDHINLSPRVALAVQHGSCWAHATRPIPTVMCWKCRTHTGVQRFRMQKNVEHLINSLVITGWNSIGDIVG